MNRPAQKWKAQMARFTEIERGTGAYEVGDAHNSVYVATLLEALRVVLSWYPDAELGQPNPTRLNRLSHDGLEAVNDYLAEVWGEYAPRISIVGHDSDVMPQILEDAHDRRT